MSKKEKIFILIFSAIMLFSFFKVTETDTQKYAAELTYDDIIISEYQYDDEEEDTKSSLVSSAIKIIIPFIFLGVILVLTSKLYKKVDNEKIDHPLNNDDLIQAKDTKQTFYIDSTHILDYISDFNEDDFTKLAFDLFSETQEGYSNFEYSILRKNLTEDFYKEYESKLKDFESRNEKNVNNKFINNKTIIDNFKINGSMIEINLLINTSCFDYIVDENNNVIFGDKANKQERIYEVILTKKLYTNNNWLICKIKSKK